MVTSINNKKYLVHADTPMCNVGISVHIYILTYYHPVLPSANTYFVNKPGKLG